MNEWQVDVFATGSQKALMLPAGLSFMAMSERAQKRAKENKQPRFYLDVLKHQTYLADNSTPFTPGMSVLMGLDRKSTRLNSSHVAISYAVFCLNKKKIR